MSNIKTPETDPDHPTVGHYFSAPNFSGPSPAVYYCDSYDPRCGFWMTDIATQERTNVSERAIGRTFHRIMEWQLEQRKAQYMEQVSNG